MSVVLISDIGGTSSRFELVQTDGDVRLKAQKYPTKDFNSLVEVISVFLEGQPLPEVAVMGTAGYITNNTVKILNVPWEEVSGEAIEKALGISRVILLNDFVVAGYGCLYLQPEDLIPLNDSVSPEHEAPVSVIGPGTGIGQCFLTWNGSNYDVWPSEGGNADFAPKTELQWKYAQYVQQMVNAENSEYPQFKPLLGATTEICFAGIGFNNLYDFLREEFPEEVNPQIEDFGNQKTQIIMELGFSGQDKICKRAVEMWMQAIGCEAGTWIAKTLPYGGFYVIGGMISRNAEQVAASEAFREALYSKAPHIFEIISRVPIYIVKHLDVGMLGCLYYAKRIALNK